MNGSTPAIVLGGTGYVAGELLRLIAGHPQLSVAAILSDSQPGAPVAGAFAHLRSAYPDLKFADLEEIETVVRRTPRCALFSAAPHGVAAGIIDRLLTAAEAAGTRLHCVDISADFRYSSSAAYEAVYKHAHGAPARIREFTCAVPEHLQKSPTPHVAHPGCFATATLLACVPLLALGLTDMRLFVTGITGSTGSGRKPVEGTHHPHRHSDLYTYGALSHRHVPEIIACAKLATGLEAELISCRIPVPSRAASMSPCRPVSRDRSARRRRWRRSSRITRTVPSCGSATPRRASKTWRPAIIRI
jgi:N-acetyl-gamma-glutamyl-phosphate reductase